MKYENEELKNTRKKLEKKERIKKEETTTK